MNPSPQYAEVKRDEKLLLNEKENEEEEDDDTRELEEEELTEDPPIHAKQGDSVVSIQYKPWISQKSSPKLTHVVASQRPLLNDCELLLLFTAEEECDEKEKLEEIALLNEKENELLLDDFPTQTKHGSVCVREQS